MPDQERGIRPLQQKLYSREGVPGGIKRKPLSPEDSEAPTGWKHDPEEQVPQPRIRKGPSTMVFLLLLSGGFFLIALAIATFMFLGNSNVVSAENVDIEVSGPVAHPGGEKLSLQISIINRNPATIELADLIIEFPEGTRSANDLNTELPRLRKSLGDIRPGERVKETIEIVLFGEEESTQQIGMTVEYRVEGSNAIFVKDEVHEILLSSAPLSLSVEALDEVISGQDIQFVVTVTSNSENLIEDVLLTAEYPFGFTFDDSTPEPIFDTNVWDIGDLSPGISRKVTIRGNIVAQDQEERTFRFFSGIQSEQNDHEVSAAFGAAVVPVTVQRPFIALDLSLNGNTAPEYVAGSGDEIRAELTLTNNLQTQVNDAKVTVTLFGTALNKSSVSVRNGFYSSSNNTITWDKNTEDKLADLRPGETNTLTFVFSPNELSPSTIFQEPEIFVEVSASGRRTSERGVPENVESTITRQVLIESDLLLSPQVVHTVGPFINSGPVPPRVDQETTYTVVWAATNSSNTVSNGRVTALLPSYVRWIGAVSPSNANVSYNGTTNTVTWDIGTINSGVGYTSEPRAVSFQIGLTPSVSQVGSAPAIIRNQVIQGIDRFTDSTIRTTYNDLTTKLSTDAGVNPGHEIVIQ